MVPSHRRALRARLLSVRLLDGLCFREFSSRRTVWLETKSWPGGPRPTLRRWRRTCKGAVDRVVSLGSCSPGSSTSSCRRGVAAVGLSAHGYVNNAVQGSGAWRSRLAAAAERSSNRYIRIAAAGAACGPCRGCARPLRMKALSNQRSSVSSTRVGDGWPDPLRCFSRSA